MRIHATTDELRSLLGPTPRRRPRATSPFPQPAGATILLAQTAYEEGLRHLLGGEPERAVLLMGPRGHRGVTHCVADTSGKSTGASFTFDHQCLNEILHKYVALGLDAKGFWHSHPSGCTRLSGGDLEYVRRIMLNPRNDVSEVLMPILADGYTHAYIVRADTPERPVKAQLVLF